MILPIYIYGQPVLRKVAEDIPTDYPKLKELLADMYETLTASDGVGLAAPQVGVLRRICVIDVTGEDPYVLINPRIVESSGEQTGNEGCLSVPNKTGVVTRPSYVKVVAQNIDMEEYELEGTELLARAICHELDHLDGIVYVTKVEGELHDVRALDDMDDDAEEDE